MGKRKTTEAVKVAKFKVIDTDIDFDEARKAWYQQADEMKQVANLIWQTWLHWHIHNKSRLQLREWLDKRTEVGVKAAGACPVKAMPSELSRKIYTAVRSEFPLLHTRAHNLFQNKILRGIQSRKASNGSLPGWSAILLYHESLPSFTRPLPIPFDAQNGTLIREDKKRYIDITTGLVKKRKGKKVRMSLFATKKPNSQLTAFDKILSGEFQFKGSNLRWSKGDKAWYVEICYQTPANRAEGLDPSKVAYLVPGRDVPFKLIFPGEKRHFWLQYKGEHIAIMRQRIFRMRRIRNANYRHGSTRRGKGRAHATGWRDRFTRTWADFVRRVNHNTSQKAVTKCVRDGIGTLVYLKPSGIVSEHRLVSNLGSTKEDQSTWEFFQLKTMLEYKCQRVGIQFSTVEFDGKRSIPKSSKGPGEQGPNLGG